MRCAIYGAGSLGTVLGAYMTKAGQPVELVNRNKEHIAALKEKGASDPGTLVLFNKRWIADTNLKPRLESSGFQWATCKKNPAAGIQISDIHCRQLKAGQIF